MLHRIQQTVRYRGADGADERHSRETARILGALGADVELADDPPAVLEDRGQPAHEPARERRPVVVRQDQVVRH